MNKSLTDIYYAISETLHPEAMSIYHFLLKYQTTQQINIINIVHYNSKSQQQKLSPSLHPTKIVNLKYGNLNNSNRPGKLNYNEQHEP